MKTTTAIAKVCDDIKTLLLEKNAKYGNSALNPKHIFSQQGSTEQILVRIDDKLSRIATTKALGGPDEDTLNDLIGYLILLKVAARGVVEPESATTKGITIDLNQEPI